uniref:PDZ domain-containing protein n=1 Tax=Timema tahoe TaxID=61484 RepID=A0A7R9ISK3_9NEOP|nr:unnamed protein product [Timema tahoe]
MHPIRRRKKRPNYGIRTVEVSRGKNGFGFTISGQQPCILSCIVAGSPAEKAGLRPGDYLVAVNSQSVSKVPHDDVVRMIGGSSGILNLQIAENYYSDSSDEDVILPTRPKPRYIHKPRQHHRGTTTQQSRAAKVVRDLRTGAMFEEQQREAVTLPTATTRVTCKSTPPLPQRWEPAPVPPPRIYPPPQGKVDSVEYRAMVGYLGTIEMPRELQPGSRLQVVRGCIKRLRAEKRAHTLVLMSVGTRSLMLTNCNQSILAEYPAERVTFCGSSSYDEQKYFGLVTSANVDTDDSGESVPSSSCHVFAVEPSLHGPHSQHSVKADTFKLCCGVDPVSGLCREFPGSSESVILAVRTLYVGREGSTQEEHLVANSPQPSNAGSTATTTSSNSDSGIGFRDDCGGNQSDRILVVDVRNQRLHIQTECQYGDGNPRLSECQHADRRLTVRAMPDPVVSSRSRSPLSGSSSDDREINKRKTKPRLEPYPERAVDYDYTSMVTQSNDNMSIGSETNKSQDAMDAMSVQSCQSQDPLLSYKLSPKVFGVPHPVTHSLEDLKGAEGPTQQWGSLQDLRTSSPQHLLTPEAQEQAILILKHIKSTNVKGLQRIARYFLWVSYNLRWPGAMSQRDCTGYGLKAALTTQMDQMPVDPNKSLLERNVLDTGKLLPSGPTIQDPPGNQPGGDGRRTDHPLVGEEGIRSGGHPPGNGQRIDLSHVTSGKGVGFQRYRHLQPSLLHLQHPASYPLRHLLTQLYPQPSRPTIPANNTDAHSGSSTVPVT